jgi:hypothetical protein
MLQLRKHILDSHYTPFGVGEMTHLAGKDSITTTGFSVAGRMRFML